MRGATLFIPLLLVQIGFCKFMEDTDRVMANTETSFSRLLSDVITDKKDVIDCTVLAVEQALLSGPSDSTSEYQRNCVDGVSDNNDEGKDASVSSLFRSRLDKLSDKIKLHPDQNDDFFNEIFTHWELLHEAEKTENNAAEIHEIHDVINEILKILQLDESKLKADDDEDKIQAIVDKLSQQAKAGEIVHQADDGCDNSTELSNNKEINSDVKTTNTITTETTNAVTSNEFTQTTQSTKKKSRKKKSDYDDDPFDLPGFLGLDVITVTDKMPDDIAEIMKSQKESESIMGKYFNNPNYIIEDAFPDLDQMTDEEIESFTFENCFGE
ncbi:hypothetical protein EVAR_39006_1 [Eumeta japonica]|uniref:Uncharacterized protein n=1 Tax=Eumeta variegata TaxID=151549 RepID=A0A4C1WPC0_EUMVA|nr:hypothetical protein EVAR_39006_1 [Eumeta japonica]